jgi:hypothetical protein
VIGFVGVYIICELERNAIDSTKRVEISSDFIDREAKFFLALEYNQFAVGMFQTFPKNYPINLDAFVFLSDHFHIYFFRIERASIRLIY